ncbi:hypothetical protein ACFXKD_20620 [Nocardiopsis aegyptia]|uniref:hypothetical protein n=1 Tax=Nocardiopsis aegyptia TaxID=220378 RepID=UPI003672363B
MMIESASEVALHLAAVPDPGAGQAPPGADGFLAILGWAKWVALGICVLGLIVAGATMAIQSRRGEGGEHLGKIGMVLGGVIVISAATSLVGFLV